VAAGGAGGTSAVAGAVATVGLGTKILAAIAVVSAVSAGAVSYTTPKAPSAPTTQVAPSNATARGNESANGIARRNESASAPVPIADRPEIPAQPAIPENAAPPAMAPPGIVPNSAPPSANVAAAPAKPVTPVAPVTPITDVSAELALLRDAHDALRNGDGARALALLDEHGRRFPRGSLVEEREAARVLALCKVGRAVEARDAASRFLREHPQSPQAERVAHACDADPNF
jgi:hypothetical protein